MKFVISVLGVLFLSASVEAAVFAPGHVFWDLTAEQDTYVVDDWIPSQDFLGDAADFTIQSSDMDEMQATATTVLDWTDPVTGQTMPGKAILMRRDSSHTGDGDDAYILLNSGGEGYDQADPMVTGRVKVSLDLMIDSSSVFDPEAGGWEREGYMNAYAWSTVEGQKLKNTVGFQNRDEEIVDYDPVGIMEQTYENYPIELGQPFYGYVHHVEMDIDLDAQTVQTWVNGNTNGTYSFPAPDAAGTGDQWTIPSLYRIQLPRVGATGSDYTQFVWDNIKVEVVEAPAGLPGDFDNDNDVDGADFLLWQRDTTVGDLSVWQNNFGQVLSVPMTAAVPEPATLVLLGLGLCGLLTIRRKKS